MTHRILILACLAAAVGAAQQPIPPLPAPSGTIVNVSTVAQLESALDAAASNSTILIAAGTYHITGSQRAIGRHGAINHVAIRGATGNRADVVIVGEGMSSATSSTAFGIKVENAQDVTFADLSIGNVYWHPIALDADQGCQRVLLHNVRLFDAGEQLLKVNPTNDTSGNSIAGVDDSTVEYCLFEYSTTAPSDYTNGVDVHHGANWVIRCNLFRNIRAPAGMLAGPTILMWNRSANTLCERNTMINCQRGIAYGLGPISSGHAHSGGVIRNNFYYTAASTAGDAPIGLYDSPNTKILHNTCLTSGNYFAAIEYRFAGTTGAVMENNLCDAPITSRDGGTTASGGLGGNLTNATSSWFVDAAHGDLHLLASATSAIDHGISVSDCPDDWDGTARPVGSARDIGGDEYVPAGGTTTGTTTGGTTTTGGSITTGTTTTGGTTTGGSATTGGTTTGGTTTGGAPIGGGASGGSGSCGLGGGAALLLGLAAIGMRVRRR